ISTPVDDVPPEVLADIFESMIDMSDAGSDSKTLLLIAGVCRRWRAILLAHPQLWTSLRLTIARKTVVRTPDVLEARLHGRLQAWYGRAGGLPLNLHMYLTTTLRK
ncbi:hypothetical protein DFP72DRAFT_759697, partial [Ephemerocybe angulata]